MTVTWTAARDWTDGELVTAAIGNIHWRDNSKYLYAFTPIYKAKTGAYAVLIADGAYQIIEATTGTWTLDLYTAVGNATASVIIKNSGTGVITVDPNSGETIDGLSTMTVGPKVSLTLVSNGANWIIV